MPVILCRSGQRPPALPPAPASLVTPNAQIVQVLNTAVEQVSQAVQDQVVASRHPVEHSAELQALVRDPHRIALLHVIHSASLPVWSLP